ncbi:hypothetical protein ES705_36248 [subsurface metagenome]
MAARTILRTRASLGADLEGSENLTLAQYHRTLRQAGCGLCYSEKSLADAICDRIVHSANRIELKVESVRELKGRREGWQEEDSERQIVDDG